MERFSEELCEWCFTSERSLCSVQGAIPLPRWEERIEFTGFYAGLYWYAVQAMWGAPKTSLGSPGADSVDPRLRVLLAGNSRTVGMKVANRVGNV